MRKFGILHGTPQSIQISDLFQASSDSSDTDASSEPVDEEARWQEHLAAEAGQEYMADWGKYEQGTVLDNINFPG